MFVLSHIIVRGGIYWNIVWKCTLWSTYDVSLISDFQLQLRQIKDETKRAVYCALIKLLLEKNLSVRVQFMSSILFCPSSHCQFDKFRPLKILLHLKDFVHFVVVACCLSVFVFAYWRCKLLRKRFYWSTSHLLGFMFQVGWGSSGVWLKGIKIFFVVCKTINKIFIEVV